MRVGVAKRVITPPPGTGLAGFAARADGARGVHDDLYARALVLEEGDQRVALILCDLCELDAPFVARVRRRVEEAAGIPPASVVVAATHTHGAPATVALCCAPPDPIWLETLEHRAADAVAEARRTLAPATAAAGRGREASVGRNRRRPDGPVDPTVTVVRFDRDDAGPASVVHYACHPTVLGPDNLLVSRDYVGFTIDAVERETGGWSGFANGACGDINVGHSIGQTVLGLPTPGRTFERAEALGLRLAGEAIRASRDARPVGGKMASRRCTVRVPLRSVPEGEARSQMRAQRHTVDALAAAGATGDAVAEARLELFYAEAALQWAEQRPGPSEATEVQAVAVGDLALVALPGEFFAESGQRLRTRSPFPYTLVIGYANGCLGYVPPASAFDEGGYETRLSPWSRVEPGAEAVVLDAAAGILAELRDATSP
ncbi:MAG TPA: neutral/alkaline non-lysosomal ceramidase N-terminal domain-containing protein [bacterium]|nr:neutral/alkaline non-lysosomal ceramidase N-terminal domain-containing protein [bacterium]